MRVPYMVGALLTAALITGCQTSTVADEEAIRDMVRAWDAAVNSRNVDALEAYYSDGAVRMNANEASIEGWEAIRASLEASFPNWGTDATDEVSEVHIEGDLATARGWWTGSQIEDGETIQNRGYWTASYQRQADGSWRCLWDMWTSALPPRPR